MSDLELIGLILLAIYVLEGTFWVKPGSVVFVSQFGERHGLRTLSESAIARNPAGGLIVGNLLPLGESCRCQQWPISFSPEGVCLFTSQSLTPEGPPPQQGRFIGWEEATGARADGRTVYLQEQPLLRVDSASLARLLAARLRDLAQLPPPKRQEAIDDFLNGLLDTKAIASRYERVHRGARTLKWTGTVLFLYLFAVAPALLLANAPVHFMQLLAAYGVLLLFSCVHFVCVHAWLYPGASAERWKQVLTMLLSPADALRLRDCLFRELLTGFHPLAVAQVLCPRPVYEEFARRVVRDIHYPLPADQPLAAAARGVERWFRAGLDRAVEALVQSSGLNPADVLAPPAAEGPDCRSYCPRCRGQFTAESGVCWTCTLPLRPLAVPGQADRASG